VRQWIGEDRIARGRRRSIKGKSKKKKKAKRGREKKREIERKKYIITSKSRSGSSR